MEQPQPSYEWLEKRNRWLESELDRKQALINELAENLKDYICRCEVGEWLETRAREVMRHVMR